MRFSHSPSDQMNPSELSMFDRIIFEAALPIKELPEEIRSQDMSELEFQTSDLGSSMNTWSVSTAGELFLHEVEKNFVKDDSSDRGFILEEKPLGIKKVEETKSVHFYRVFESEESDYWVSFDALFHKGELLLVEVNQISKINKEERKEAKARAQEFLDGHKEKTKWRKYKALAPFKLLIGLLLVSLHWTGSNLSKLHSRL